MFEASATAPWAPRTAARQLAAFLTGLRTLLVGRATFAAAGRVGQRTPRRR